MPFFYDGAKALALADRLIALDPLNTTAHYRRGTCLYFLRRYAEAIKAFNKALTIAPQSNNPRYFLSSSLILLNRPDEARAVLTKMPVEDAFRQTDEAILAARSGDRASADGCD